MGLVKATAIFQFKSSLPRDVAENTFFFRVAGPSASSDEVTTIVAALTNFYTNNPPGGDTAISDYFNDYIISGTGAWTIRLAGVDVTTGFETTTEALIPRDITIPPNVGYPLEVALCLSFNANPLVLSQRARARGRVYIGPLSSIAAIQTDPLPPRPKLIFMETVADAAENLLNESVTGAAGGDPAPWVIYSRADADTKDVVGGWVDDEWDTQRRRGVRAGFRNEFGAVI